MTENLVGSASIKDKQSGAWPVLIIDIQHHQQIIMKKRYLAFLYLALVGPVATSSPAADCLVSTNPPAIIRNYPGISEDKLNEEDGFYLASLENGDNLMVSFSSCELALRGHYLLGRDLQGDELKETVITFVTQLLPAQGDRKKIIEQLANQSYTPGSGIMVQGTNDEHRITISESSSPFFVSEIHNEWLPPLH